MGKHDIAVLEKQVRKSELIGNTSKNQDDSKGDHIKLMLNFPAICKK